MNFSRKGRKKRKQRRRRKRKGKEVIVNKIRGIELNWIKERGKKRLRGSGSLLCKVATTLQPCLVAASRPDPWPDPEMKEKKERNKEEGERGKELVGKEVIVNKIKGMELN